MTASVHRISSNQSLMGQMVRKTSMRTVVSAASWPSFVVVDARLSNTVVHNTRKIILKCECRLAASEVNHYSCFNLSHEHCGL
jgi:hypothetical protein